MKIKREKKWNINEKYIYEWLNIYIYIYIYIYFDLSEK